MARRPYTLIRRNVERIIEAGGNEQEINQYLASEGYNQNMWQAGTQAYNRSMARSQSQPRANRTQPRANRTQQALSNMGSPTDAIINNTLGAASAISSRAAPNSRLTRGIESVDRRLDAERAARNIGVLQGLTANWGDEAIGLISPNAQRDYRAAEQEAQGNNALSYGSGQFLGSIMPFARGAQGAGRVSRLATRPIVRNALAGGAQGAIAGAGAADNGNRAGGAVVGGVGGAVVGGGATALGNAARPVIQRVRGGRNRNVPNSPQVQQTASRFILNNTSNLSDEASRLSSAGLDNVTPIDTSRQLSREVNRMARGASNRSTAKDTLSQAARARTSSVAANANREIRRRGRAPRTNQELNQELTARQSRAVSSRIRPVVNNRIPLNDAQQSILASSEMRSPINKTIGLLDLEASRNQVRNLPDSMVLGAVSRNDIGSLPQGNALMAEPPMPVDVSIGGAETLRQILQERASKAFEGGENNLARVLTATKNDVINPFREAVPQYDEALRFGENYHQAREALDQGTDDINKTSLPDIQENMRGLNPLARYAYGQGAVNRLADNFLNDNNSPNLLGRLMRQGDQQAALRQMIGDDRARQIQEAAGALDQRYTNWTLANPNAGSQTARLMGEDGVNLEQNIPTSTLQVFRNVIGGGINKASNFTDAEREAIVNLAAREVGDNPEQFQRILEDLANLDTQRMPNWLQDAISRGSGQFIGTNVN